jgi:hypothetical protein
LAQCSEDIDFDESPESNEEINEIRPPSPTCSSTDEYDEFPDPEPEPPAIQSPDDSINEPDQEYERPPLDWNDMDPAQRLTWLREHQLPNQKPSKLLLTDSQDLTRRQIGRLKKSKGPESFHAQSSKTQFDSQQNKADLQSPFHAFTTSPTQIPQPNLPFPEKRSYQEQHNDPKETKKRKLKVHTMNLPLMMTHHSNLQHHSSTPTIAVIIIIHHHHHHRPKNEEALPVVRLVRLLGVGVNMDNDV